jgi:hypothetical protein
MKSRKANAELLIEGVVAGERPWTDLRPLGMEAQPDQGRCQFLPKFPDEVQVHIFHVVRGFRAYMHHPCQLREWAFVVEALPIDVVDVDIHPAGEAVMAAVWSASFGDPLRADQISLIEDLAHEDEYDP